MSAMGIEKNNCENHNRPKLPARTDRMDAVARDILIERKSIQDKMPEIGEGYDALSLTIGNLLCEYTPEEVAMGIAIYQHNSNKIIEQGANPHTVKLDWQYTL